MIDSYTIINISKLKWLYISIHSKQEKKLLYISAASPIKHTIKRKKSGKKAEKMSVYVCYIVSVKKLASS